MKFARIVAVACLAVGARHASAQVTINFDDTTAPNVFTGTTHLTNAYAAQGVTFQGPGGNDGFAVLTASTFSVTGFSGLNIFCGNTNPISTLSDGGKPVGPETLLFSTPVSFVQIKAADGSGDPDKSVTLDAYDAGDALVATISRPVSSVLQNISVSGRGIVRAVLTTDAPVPVFDDLLFAEPPANDDCANATVVGSGAYRGSTAYATKDGLTICGSPGGAAPDVWYKYTPSDSGRILINTAGSSYDTAISVHTGCPATPENTLVCNDDGGVQPDTNATFQSALYLKVTAGVEYLIRVAGFSAARGAYVLSIGDPTAPAPQDACAWIPQFPSANSTVVASGPGFATESETGFIWSRTAGHKVEETINGDRGAVTSAEFLLNLTENSLTDGMSLDLSINGTLVGILSIPAGVTGPISYNAASFPAIDGPSYDIKLEPRTDVPDGAGDIKLGYAGAAQGYVVLKSTPGSTIFDATQRGWWDSDGNHSAINNNTFTGHADSGTILNSYFTFNTVRSLTAKSATLRLEVAAYFGTDPSESFAIHAVSTAASTLEADGVAQTAIFNDLADGGLLGTFTVTPADVGSVIEIPLTDTGLRVLNSYGSEPSVGITCTTLSGLPGDEGARFSNNSEARTHQLALEYCPDSDTVPPTLDFANDNFPDWFGGLAAGSGSAFTGTTGICMEAPALGDNIPGWVSPQSYCPLRDATVYRMQIVASSTQTTENAIPFLSFIYDNFPSNTYGGELLILDNTGGANGVSRPQGRTVFEHWAAPNAVETLQWRGLLDNGVPGENDNSAFTPSADTSNDMRLVIRLNDIGSAGINANADEGVVCIRSLKILAYALAELLPDGAPVYNPPINSQTHGAERFDQMGAGTAEIDDTTMDARFALLPDGLGSRKTLFPWDRTLGDVPFNFIFYPIPWESGKLLKASIGVRSRVNVAEGTDPLDIIGVIMDTSTIEAQVVHLTSRGNPGNMDRAASPRRTQTTGGVPQNYTGYFFTENKTAIDTVANPGADRLRVQADFINLAEIAPQGQGADPFAATEMKVERIIIP